MAGCADLDLYNVLLGFAWTRERAELRRTVSVLDTFRARRSRVS